MATGQSVSQSVSQSPVPEALLGPCLGGAGPVVVVAILAGGGHGHRVLRAAQEGGGACREGGEGAWKW